MLRESQAGPDFHSKSIEPPRPLECRRYFAAELSELVELLAENAHDIGAEKSLAENWTYGPRCDDVAKRHPCLVCYSALPESEEEYDRELIRRR